MSQQPSVPAYINPPPMPSRQCQKNLIAQGGRYIYTHGDKTEILSTPYKEALPFLGVLAQRHTAVNEHSRGKTKNQTAITLSILETNLLT